MQRNNKVAWAVAGRKDYRDKKIESGGKRVTVHKEVLWNKAELATGMEEEESETIQIGFRCVSF